MSCFFSLLNKKMRSLFITFCNLNENHVYCAEEAQAFETVLTVRFYKTFCVSPCFQCFNFAFVIVASFRRACPSGGTCCWDWNNASTTSSTNNGRCFPVTYELHYGRFVTVHDVIVMSHRPLQG